LRAEAALAGPVLTGSALRAVTAAPCEVTYPAGSYPRIGWPHGLLAA
jgi:hypothetical protein